VVASWQKSVLPVMVGDKLVLSDTLVLVVPIQPKLSVTVTIMLGSDVLKVAVCVASPVDHVYCAYPLPASKVVLKPSQKLVLPVMVGVGLGCCVTVVAAVPVQPLALVTVTVRVCALLMLVVGVFTPVDQAYCA